MFEQVLQDGENIVMHEEGIHCGDGAVAAIKAGHLVLTDRRLIILKSKAAAFSMGNIIGFVVGVAIVLVFITGANLGFIEAAVLGAVFGGGGTFVGAMVEKAIKKDKPSTAQYSASDTEFSINLDEIASAEDGSRGVQKMVVIKTKGGELRKIGLGKNNAQWKAALQKN